MASAFAGPMLGYWRITMACPISSILDDLIVNERLGWNGSSKHEWQQSYSQTSW
jgi:hypothetical protein